MCKKKKIMMLLMTMALSVSSFAGCGQSDSSTPKSTAAAENDADGATTDTYEVATVRWADWGEDYHTGFPDAAAKETGIQINWDTILNADWADKKSVLLASGELPDAFMGSICFSETDILSNTGTFIALDDYIDEYMPNFKSIMESDPTMKSLATSADGHIYQPGEKITAVIPIREYTEGHFLFMATKKGIVKKTPITDYANVRKTGLAAISLREDDELIEVKKTDNNQDVFLVTKYGQCIRFKETDVRKTGRTSMGVIGMNLTDGDEVIGMQMQSQGDALMIVSEKGLGKCTLISEFTTQNRGGKGVKCYKITEKTGNIVGVKAVNQDNELMLITTEGIIIRIKVSDTTLLGRITSGVKLINLDENVTVASIAKVREDKSLIDNADTSELLSEEEEKESAAIAAENAKKASVENTETDDELMKELLERAEADGSEDEEE